MTEPVFPAKDDDEDCIDHLDEMDLEYEREYWRQVMEDLRDEDLDDEWEEDESSGTE